MHLLTLSHIDEELDSSEVAALCFLCRDVMKKKRREKVKDAKELFQRLEEKGLLENHHFLQKLLETIGRIDLLNFLETDSSRTNASSDPQTDASPILSHYRVMLYQIHEDMTQENLDKMKYLLSKELSRGQLESCTTALDVMAEMEEKGLLSKENMDMLKTILEQCDRQLVKIIHREGTTTVPQRPSVQPISSQYPHYSMDNQRAGSVQPSLQGLSITESQPSIAHHKRQEVNDDQYKLTSKPSGLCVIMNNENFEIFTPRPGTNKDAVDLARTFSWLGFRVLMFKDRTKSQMEETLKRFSYLKDLTELLQESKVKEWSREGIEFINPNVEILPQHGDAFVCCIMSHGDKGGVFGTDGEFLHIDDITKTFNGMNCCTLVDKPKVFFIQACQDKKMVQLGVEVEAEGTELEDDAVVIQCNNTMPSEMACIPVEADFLIAMSTVENYLSFRDTINGSWFIQSLWKQLEKGCRRGDDLMTILYRVNSDVSQREGTPGKPGQRKQMSEVKKVTLRKKLVFTPISD